MQIPIVNLRPEAFPMLVEAFAILTGEKVWETTVQNPGPSQLTTLRVPPLRCTHGPVRVRITYADGEVQDADTGEA